MEKVNEYIIFDPNQMVADIRTQAQELIKSDSDMITVIAEQKGKAESGVTTSLKSKDLLKVVIEDTTTGNSVDLLVEVGTSIKEIIEIAIEQMGLTQEKASSLALKYRGRVVTHRINIITIRTLLNLQQGDILTLQRLEKLSVEYLELCNKLADIFHLTRSQFSNLLYGSKNTLDYILGRNIFITEETTPRIISELMYRLSLIDKNDPMFSKYHSDIDFVKDGIIKALTVCKNYLDQKGYNSIIISLSINEVKDNNFRKTLLNKIKLLTGDMKYRSHTLKEAREWYFEQELRIKDIIDKDLSLFEQAKQAFHLRNYIRIMARLFMKDGIMLEELTVIEPVLLWENLVNQKIAEGFRGNEIWLEIIKGAGRSRASVNRYLGINK